MSKLNPVTQASPIQPISSRNRRQNKASTTAQEKDNRSKRGQKNARKRQKIDEYI